MLENERVLEGQKEDMRPAVIMSGMIEGTGFRRHQKAKNEYQGDKPGFYNQI